MHASTQPERQKQALPCDSDELAASALAVILDPSANRLPAEIFTEFMRRNAALTERGNKAEIKAMLGRQAVLLEALATRQLGRAAMLPAEKVKVANLFIGQALGAQKAMTLALSALYQMAKDEDATLPLTATTTTTVGKVANLTTTANETATLTEVASDGN